MTLDEARQNIGQLVTCAGGNGRRRFEDGLIKSVDARYVFVKFGNAKPIACSPQDVKLVPTLAIPWEA